MKRKKSIFNSEFWGTSVGFWVTFSVFFTVVGLSFLIAYELFRDGSGEPVEKYVSPLADSFSVVIGLPVAFAGSVVAIILAQKSLTISRRQEHYESVAFVEGYVNDVYERYVAAANSLREYMSDVADLSSCYFESYDNKETLFKDGGSFEKIKEDLLSSRRGFKNAVSACAHNLAISQLWKDNESHCKSLVGKVEVYRKSLLDEESRDEIESLVGSYSSSAIRDRLYTIGSVKSISNFVSLLDYYYEVEDFCEDVEEAVNLTPLDYEEDFDSLLNPWDHILVSGLFLCNKSSVKDVETDVIDDNTGLPFIRKEMADNLNYGAAFICDFLRFRPSSAQVKSVLKKRLSEITHVDGYVESYIDRLVDNKDFDQMFPSKLCFSADYISAHEELLYTSEHQYWEGENKVANWYLHEVLKL